MVRAVLSTSLAMKHALSTKVQGPSVDLQQQFSIHVGIIRHRPQLQNCAPPASGSGSGAWLVDTGGDSRTSCTAAAGASFSNSSTSALHVYRIAQSAWSAHNVHVLHYRIITYYLHTIIFRFGWVVTSVALSWSWLVRSHSIGFESHHAHSRQPAIVKRGEYGKSSTVV